MTDYDPHLTLAKAARRYLAQDSGIQAVLGTGQGVSLWLFVDRPLVKVEGSGQAAVVLAQRGGWATPNQHNTMAFPELQVEVWADLERFPDGNPKERTAEDLAHDVHLELDRLLHLTDGQLHEWGNGSGKIRVIRSFRLREPDAVEVPEGDGMIRSTTAYGIILG